MAGTQSTKGRASAALTSAVPLSSGSLRGLPEHIAVPLLLVAGGGDAVWPSGEMAERLLDRRQQARVAAAEKDQLLTYPDAGHLIRLGCWPTTVTHAGSIELGGTPAGLAAAQADLTPRVISVLTS